MAKSSLDQLKETGTVVVSDSGDFETIAKYKPQDATTNPSLIFAAAKKAEYSKLVDRAIEFGKKQASSVDDQVEHTLDRLLVEFGREILQIVPGRVSTEIDARFSFDKQATINKALHIIGQYEELGIDKDRVLVKIASTWEGIQAAHELEQKHGVHCNLTLLFSFVQAVACAEAGVTLISPFVGRISDWYKKETGKSFEVHEDPGILSVARIFKYYQQHQYKTIVMAASFRTVSQIKELAGIDFVTVSPALLEQLYNSTDSVSTKLYKDKFDEETPEVSYLYNEPEFRFHLSEDAMATQKLSEGISKFAADALALKKLLREKIES